MSENAELKLENADVKQQVVNTCSFEAHQVASSECTKKRRTISSSHDHVLCPFKYAKGRV
eukprot:3399933-Pyramimonas_sp.AAC.1